MITPCMRSGHLLSTSNQSFRVISKMSFVSLKLIKWVTNPAKFQVMFLGTKDKNIEFLSENTSIVSCEFVKLLGICIDKGLNFKHHTSRYAPKPLRRLKHSGEFSHSKPLSCYIMLILNIIFKYCPLIWMNFIKGWFGKFIIKPWSLPKPKRWILWATCIR